MPTRRSKAAGVPSKGRRTDPGQPDMVTPKGYDLYCNVCLDDAGLEFMLSEGKWTTGKCANCGKTRARTMFETGRFEALLGEAES